MKWQGRSGSGNVEDRRGMGGKIAIGGGLGGVIVLILSLLFGGNLTQSDIDALDNSTQGQQENYTPSEAENEEAQFVSVVLKDTEDVWNELFQERGANYIDPHLVLFTNSVESACGNASAATVPFYCPLDSKVLYRSQFL